MKALAIHAGPAALKRLAEVGLRAQDIGVVAGAAGGPKGLTLLPIDRFVFGQWLPSAQQPVHLVGASIGAWRMATACSPNPVDGFNRLAHDYIHERYGMADGDTRLPGPERVSALFAQVIQRHFQADLSAIVSHPRWHLHVLASRGVGLLGREGPWRTPAGYVAAVALNACSRRAMGALLHRVVFSAGAPLPLDVSDLPSHRVDLTPRNLQAALLASCAIPFWLKAVTGIEGAPPGPYWDGGITDYHVHLNHASLPSGLALVPHFQPRLVPGWLDKPLKHRHRRSPFLDNAVVLSPTPQWVATLPGGKLPDRSDFKRWLQQPQERERRWTQAHAASQALADELGELTTRSQVLAQPLP